MRDDCLLKDDVGVDKTILASHEGLCAMILSR
jgi:hypothetical protein